MKFNDLVQRVNSNKPVKIYMIDHIHPGILTGYATNPRKKDASFIDLDSYVAMFGFFSNNYDISGQTKYDKTYQGLLFQGRSVTTDFDEHKKNVEKFLKTNKYSNTNVDKYLKVAKEL